MNTIQKTKKTGLTTLPVFFVRIGLVLIFLLSLCIKAYPSNLDSFNEEPHHCYFKKNSVSIGLGATHSLDQNVTGLNTRVLYNLKEHLCFGPEFSLIQSQDLEIIDLGIVVHYIFDLKPVGLYPILGANLIYEKEHNTRHKALGLTYGLGLHRNFGSLTLYTEYTRVESNLNDVFLTGGFMYTIH